MIIRSTIAESLAVVMADEQEKLLDEALGIVKVQAFQMKRCLDKVKLMDGLKHASTMLSELRTSLLSPKSYYELYMATCDELRHLELYLTDEFQKGRKVSDLYELVQYAGNIVPRLYLLITVGTVYIKTNEYSRKDILRDLVEMCRGVQHPLRGLFLRNYLLQCTRNVLPDTLEPGQFAEGEDPGRIDDSIDFIQVVEVLVLVLVLVLTPPPAELRGDEQAVGADAAPRPLQGAREEGEGADGAPYPGGHQPGQAQPAGDGRRGHVRPAGAARHPGAGGELQGRHRPGVPHGVHHPGRHKALDHMIIDHNLITILSSPDHHLIITCQVFPDEFHLACLTSFLEACAELQPAVNVKNIVIGLIDRLAAFATREDSPGIPDNIQLFHVFSEEISSIIKARPDMPPEDIVSLEVSLMNLAHKCYQERIDLIDTVLDNTKQLFANAEIQVVEHRTPVGRELERLLKIPVDSYNDVLVVLGLEHFIPLLNCYDYSGRKEMSAYLVNNVIDNSTVIPTPEKVETILTIVAPLVTDQPDGPTAEQSRAEEREEWEEEQGLMGRLVHLLQAETPDQQYLVLTTARSVVHLRVC